VHLRVSYRRKSKNAIRLVREGRRFEVAGWGQSSEYEGILEMTTRVAKENVDKVEQALAVGALGGERALLARH
jgi:hypothetical protein